MLDLYKHNEVAYEKMKEMFLYEDKVAIVHPTGTGKMYIALKWLYENRNKKCLFLCSYKSIIHQLKETIEKNNLSLGDFPNLKLSLYRNLLNWDEFDYSQEYDCIVLDEFHRAGAPKWGKCVSELLENQIESKVLGLSATPTRFVDKKNVADEIFEGNVASEITLSEAIADEILPFPHYVGCVYHLIDEVAKREKQINSCDDLKKKKVLDDLLMQAKKHLENVDGIQDIIQNHIKESGKYIIFCKDINHIYSMKEDVKKWFSNIGGVKEYIVHSDLDSDYNEETLKKFEADKENVQLLFSVDMLNEGIHFNDIDGIIMLRTTESHIVFLQQLGRCLSVTGKIPTVIDVANNIEAYENIYDVRDQILEYMGYDGYNDERIPKELREKFKIYGYAKNIVNILKEIDFIYRPVLLFDEKIVIVKEFLKETGNLYSDIKDDDKYNEYPIGNWKTKWRGKYNKGKLPFEQEAILRELGEDFLKQRVNFETAVHIIKKYLDENNLTYCDILYSTKYKNYPIGHWKSLWRENYNKGKLLSEEEIVLRKLGEDFKRKASPSLGFDKKIEIVKEYMKKTGKTYSDIKDSEKYDEYPIGNWKTKWRGKYNAGKLSMNEENILRELGEDFIGQKIKFEKAIEIIVKYLNEHNLSYSDILSGAMYGIYPIGQWKNSWRVNYNKGKLPSEEEAVLRKLGEDFKRKTPQSLEFDKKIEIIKEYMRETGKIYSDIKDAEKYGEHQIGKWKTKWRGKYNAGKLSVNEENILRQLGENFERKQSELVEFEKKIEIIRKYMKEQKISYSNIIYSTEYDGYPLGQWMNQFRKNYRNKKLDSKEELILRELGENFESKKAKNIKVNTIPNNNIVLEKTDSNKVIVMDIVNNHGQYF